MKKLILLLCICAVAPAVSLFAQAPTASPIASPPVATPIATPNALGAVGSPSDLADTIQRDIEKHFRGGKHGIIIEGNDHGRHKDEIPAMVIPLVGIVFLTIFGAPVLIVLAIGIFTLLLSRSRQRTIRMMVEKGQPVPPELLASHTRAVRQRSDVRRGVIWTMIGLGAMVFFGAVNEWEGGVWSIGLIPFLIGLGYLLVWKLEGKKNVPPPPPGP
jgi:hypothetical protein